MPEPRRLRELDSHLPAVSLQSQETRQAEAASRRRRGAAGRVPVEIRNGLPWKPYRYQGTGYDQITGGDDDARAVH